MDQIYRKSRNKVEIWNIAKYFTPPNSYGFEIEIEIISMKVLQLMYIT